MYSIAWASKVAGSAMSAPYPWAVTPPPATSGRIQLVPMQASTTTRDVGLRGPLTPGPAVAERRAPDLLPSPDAVHGRGATAWTAALVASLARTTWLSAVVTLAFLGGAFGSTVARGHSVTTALPWVLIGGAVWLVIALTWALLRHRR